ncbi:TAXI family TRAP transporter solute-binding subunit [Halalkalibacter alkaliphilus]|uniref:TAXI family TRAP transporter solute-binding subunit n=1 Tax=Halalkalibacter alkaliphilus TaxID=2917993 RepID=A0A9X2CUF7_9BACI|nr:TAXI family TRAP transporter solute-binding subunit [Halalkalibacter alkaliphilus]MCL7748545.1 TAXI family TRAP transporter solute-binding subunit [Halalkalibacter alkaliphilus]
MRRVKGLLLLMFLVVGSLFITACGVEKSESASGSEGQEENTSSEAALEKKENVRLDFATNPSGSAYNASSAGIAGLINDKTDIHVTVTNHSGPDAYLPMLQESNVDLALATSPVLKWAYNGEENYSEPHENLRTILRGSMIDGAVLVVREDAGIETTADLKGKRVAADYGAHKHLELFVTIQLEAAGLTWDDVVPVPVSGAQQGTEALRDGRVDATFGGALTNAGTMEADSAIGLKILHVADVPPEELDSFPADIMQRFQEEVPGFQVVPKSGGIAGEEEYSVTAYPISLVTSAALGADHVYKILEAQWDYYEELHPVFSWLEEWHPDTYLDPDPAMPYHDGAVQFYKDKGVWTDELEEKQQELLN